MILFTQFSCMSTEKKLLKRPDGNFNRRKENRIWKRVIENYKDSMSVESKKIWGAMEVISQ